MAFSDCEKCWDTPCTCGWGYRKWPDDRIKELRDVLEGILNARCLGTAVRVDDPPPPKLSAADYQRTITVKVTE